MVWLESGLFRLVRRSGLCQELLKMCEQCGVLHLRWWSNARTVFRLWGKGQILILIYHADVFSSGMWYDGLFGQWSGGSLISDGLLADAWKVALFLAVAACLSLGLAYVTWVLSFAATEEARLAVWSVWSVWSVRWPLRISGWCCGCGIMTCSSIEEWAKSLFVCWAASKDMAWLTTKASVKGGFLGLRCPSL